FRGDGVFDAGMLDADAATLVEIGRPYAPVVGLGRELSDEVLAGIGCDLEPFDHPFIGFPLDHAGTLRKGIAVLVDLDALVGVVLVGGGGGGGGVWHLAEVRWSIIRRAAQALFSAVRSSNVVG